MSPAKLAAPLIDIFRQIELCLIIDDLLRGQQNGLKSEYTVIRAKLIAEQHVVQPRTVDDTAFFLTIQKADRQPWRPWSKGTEPAAKRQQTQKTPSPASPPAPQPLYCRPAYTYPRAPATYPYYYASYLPTTAAYPIPSCPLAAASASIPYLPRLIGSPPSNLEIGQRTPHLLVADGEFPGQSAYLLRSIRDCLVASVTPQMGTRQRGLICYPNGYPSGLNDIPTPIASLLFLPPGICHVIAFWGAFTPLKRLVVTTHMVFIQLRGSHRLVASQAVET